MVMNDKVNAGGSIECHDNIMTIPHLPPLPVATSRRRGTAGVIATVTLSNTESINDTEMSNNSRVVNTNNNTNVLVEFNSSNDFTIPSLPILKSTRKINAISSLDSMNNSMNKENHNPTSVTSSIVNSTSSPLIKSNGQSPNTQVKFTSLMSSKRLLSSPLHTSSISTSTPTTIQRRQKRVLRNGDTIESLFCLKKKTKTNNNNNSSATNTENCILFNTPKYYDKIKSLCNDICNDIDNSSNDIQKWKEVLTFAYWNVHQYYYDDDGRSSTSDDIDGDMGSNLIRLHRRATSRFSTNVTEEYKQQNPNYEKDLLSIWLQYVKVRYEFNKNEDGTLSSSTENDIRSTFQLLQNKKLDQLYAEYYVALADFEIYIGKSKKIQLGISTTVRDIIETGIKIGAQPTQLLNDYIEKLEKGTAIKVIETDEGSHKKLDSVPSVSQEEQQSYEVENISAENSLVSVLRSRTTKRPLTSIRSKIRIKTGSTSSSSMTSGSLRMGGPPKRLESIDDDDIEDDEEDFDRQDDFEDNLNDLNTKRPKIAYLEKSNEKITSEYRNFLEQWDPMKRSNTRNISGGMDAIEENTKENQPTLTVGNNTASTGSRSHHSNQSNAELSLQSSVQSNITKKDDMTTNNTNNNAGRTPQNDESVIEAPIHSSPSMTLPGVDVDFLSLIQEKKVVFVNNKKYLKLGVIGKGGSCKVYRSLTKELCTVAIKKVNLKGMTKQSVEGYANEIELLRTLRGNQSIVQLYDSEVDIKRKAIFLVMEAGEADLNHVLKDQATRNSLFGNKDLHMNFIRSIWQQMLSVVHCIHEENIIHGDLKPANFLFVKGVLKLIDFGIAKAIQYDITTNIYRDSQVGTLNYMSPESIQDSGTCPDGQRMKCGRASDVWSLGCILYQMCYGHTPFAHIHNMIAKLQAIINPSHEIEFPETISPAAIDAIKLCLRRKPEERAPIIGSRGLLNEHWFLHCDKK